MAAMENPITLRQARTRYFQENNFGETGGYELPWADFSLGPIPFPFPNSAARVRAIRYHDLHHVLTGYGTSTVEEFEISAWELAAGCKDYSVAWALNLSGMAMGILVAPRRTARAFARGLGDRSLYGEDFEALLEMRVAEARAKYLAPTPRRKLGWSGTLKFLAYMALATVVSNLSFLLLAPLVPVGIVAMNILRRRSAT